MSIWNKIFRHLFPESIQSFPRRFFEETVRRVESSPSPHLYREKILSVNRYCRSYLLHIYGSHSCSHQGLLSVSHGSIGDETASSDLSPSRRLPSVRFHPAAAWFLCSLDSSSCLNLGKTGTLNCGLCPLVSLTNLFPRNSMTFSSLSSTFSILRRSGVFAMNPVSHIPAAKVGWFSTLSINATFVLIRLYHHLRKSSYSLPSGIFESPAVRPSPLPANYRRNGVISEPSKPLPPSRRMPNPPGLL